MMLGAVGTILLVAGALVSFVVDARVDGVTLVALGWVLMTAGALGILVDACRSAWADARRSTAAAPEPPTVGESGRV